MLAVVPAATLHGLAGRPIRVEVDVAPGLPGCTIVGLADTALQEARERVRGAIRNAGFTFPPRRITINLAPADLRKAGASLDLAMAIGILLGSEQVRPGAATVAFLGELSLTGDVRAVPGILPMVAALAAQGVGRVVLADAAVEEARLVAGIAVTGVGTLEEAATAIRARRARRTPVAMPRVSIEGGPPDRGWAPAAVPPLPPTPDLAEVRGQHEARRALEIALAGGHGLLLVGPPGVGKTLLARTIPGLVPDLDDAAALSVTVVASAAGEGPITALRRQPPFRAPHHTLSYAGMVGGGPHLAPGEVTRADRGILFLDELAEFDRDVLEALRQPLEEGRVTIVRAGRATTFPARFQLVAAMNPCPCGFAGSVPEGRCRCPAGVVERYERRVSGPLRDRIDLWITMPRVPPRPSWSVGRRSRRRSSRPGSRPPVSRAARRSAGGPNARLRGPALRSPPAGWMPPPGSDWSSSPRAKRRADAARSACSGWPGRSPTSRARQRSSSSTSTRRPGTTRRPWAAPRRWPPDVLGVSAAGPLAADTRGRCRAPARTTSTPTRPNVTRGRSWPRSTVSAPSPSRRCSSATGPGGRSWRQRPSPAVPTASRRRRPASTPATGPCRRRCRSVSPMQIAGAADGGMRILDRVRSFDLRVVTMEEPAYPSRLAAVAMPPHVLFVRGEVAALHRERAVAVVGTRHATTAGRTTAGRIATALVAVGATVVSGLAIGIDGAAHEATLRAGGITVAVIGGGHGHLSPARHDRLAMAIVAGGGAVVSEHAPDIEPTHGTFPRRNRIISGASEATVVVEAPARSGALITASWALEQGRGCFLVPGTIDAPASSGCLAFLREFADEARIVAGIPQLIADLGYVGAARVR